MKDLKETYPLLIVFIVLILIDLTIIGGVLYKANANFVELYKNLNK